MSQNSSSRLLLEKVGGSTTARSNSGPRRAASQKTQGVVADELVLRAGQIVEGHVPPGPIEMGRRQIDRQRRGRPARRRIDRERAGVGKQVEESLAGGRLADHPAGDAVIEEQARVDVVGQVDLEAQSALGDDLGAAFLGDALILRRAAMPLRAA